MTYHNDFSIHYCCDYEGMQHLFDLLKKLNEDGEEIEAQKLWEYLHYAMNSWNSDRSRHKREMERANAIPDQNLRRDLSTALFKLKKKYELEI